MVARFPRKAVGSQCHSGQAWEWTRTLTWFAPTRDKCS